MTVRLTDVEWDKLSSENGETHSLTPLIWEHVNPYGRFDLDMNTRLDLP